MQHMPEPRMKQATKATMQLTADLLGPMNMAAIQYTNAHRHTGLDLMQPGVMAHLMFPSMGQCSC